jgi:hypothetical protein
MRPSSITATVSPTARRHLEVLLHQQHGGALRLELPQRGHEVAHDGRREALAGLVDEDERTRLDDGARHGKHLLLAAAELARGCSQKRRSAGKRPKTH